MRSGEEHTGSKLDWEKVGVIRRSEDLNDAELARYFGVDRATVRLIRENATWHDPEYEPRPTPGRSAR